MDPRAIVNTAVDTLAGGIPDDIRADYLACYDGDRFVESMRTPAGMCQQRNWEASSGRSLTG